MNHAINDEESRSLLSNANDINESTSLYESQTSPSSSRSVVSSGPSSLRLTARVLSFLIIFEFVIGVVLDGKISYSSSPFSLFIYYFTP